MKILLTAISLFIFGIVAAIYYGQGCWYFDILVQVVFIGFGSCILLWFFVLAPAGYITKIIEDWNLPRKGYVLFLSYRGHIATKEELERVKKMSPIKYWIVCFFVLLFWSGLFIALEIGVDRGDGWVGIVKLFLGSR
ncbi:MAG: hypothetical protein HQL15_05790 [Candidatus Omnitrophica bacterium]|nr:hypothetical protein [Candidatus Omnitrophota bacterium]